MDSNGKVVCVTGASGFIASWLVKLLLQRGYTVRATVRNPDDPHKTSHLLALDGADTRLRLVKANLLEEGSFDAAIDGCDCVFHTASPVLFSVEEPQSELMDPAVKGTLNVLGSCVKASSVKRVVLTSSMAAVLHTERVKSPEVIVDETWHSSEEICKNNKPWYVLSKLLAEDAAWKFAKENNVDLVAINPAVVIGPLLQPTLNTSSAIILRLINGSDTYANFSFGWVNVKDVALAHILAFENPSASGRYCLVDSVEHFSKVIKRIHEMFPAIKLPEKCADDQPFATEYKVSKEKAESLGVNFTSMDVSLKETIESLVEKKFAKI
ncbi:Cinnamoyl CoA reductase-like protein [Zostera marina]|uniref:Cinnamoyl CoA reductase-like protein n=1 Tax=Zostera marina TaxID=29655 RepID=A0A0K9PPB2_ZOSMR|nr:Cinnamoyl CoA reductase-like protein [Zostera marina]